MPDSLVQQMEELPSSGITVALPACLRFLNGPVVIFSLRPDWGSDFVSVSNQGLVHFARSGALTLYLHLSDLVLLASEEIDLLLLSFWNQSRHIF